MAEPSKSVVEYVHEVVGSVTGIEGAVRYCLVPVMSGLELTLRASFKVNTVK